MSVVHFSRQKPGKRKLEGIIVGVEGFTHEAGRGRYCMIIRVYEKRKFVEKKIYGNWSVVFYRSSLLDAVGTGKKIMKRCNTGDGASGQRYTGRPPPAEVNPRLHGKTAARVEILPRLEQEENQNERRHICHRT